MTAKLQTGDVLLTTRIFKVLGDFVFTAIRGIVIVALTLAYFGWNAHIRADEESIIPRAEDDAAKEAEADAILITKLKFIDEESIIWAIRPGFPAEKNGNAFRYLDSLGQSNRATARPGDTFFTEEPAASRFKFLGHETREVFNERIGKKEIRTFARIEDQHPNKLGVVYEIPAPLPAAILQQHRHIDRTAIFTLDAANPGGDEFKIEEFATFTLPPDGEGPTYKLASVNADEAVIEFVDADGKSWSVTIPKVGLPEE